MLKYGLSNQKSINQIVIGEINPKSVKSQKKTIGEIPFLIGVITEKNNRRKFI